jgi:uncharacterized protein (TIGR02145 family)
MHIKKSISIEIVTVFYLTTFSYSGSPEITGTVTDIDGNVYKTVKIGNQEWMAENLRVTKYNDGSVIPLSIGESSWGHPRDARYCYYNDTTNIDSVKKHGALYTWYVIDPTNPKKIAPIGWHVSSNADWDILENYLIANRYNYDRTTKGNKIAKSLAAKTDWDTISTQIIGQNVITRTAGFDITIGAIGRDLTKNNRSGFSALPVGHRYDNGNFSIGRYYGQWWCATEIDASYAWSSVLGDNEYDERNSRGHDIKSCGFSVRLVRD